MDRKAGVAGCEKKGVKPSQGPSAAQQRSLWTASGKGKKVLIGQRTTLRVRMGMRLGVSGRAYQSMLHRERPVCVCGVRRLTRKPQYSTSIDL